MPMSALAPQPSSDPVAAFTACHDRIRRFLDGLSRIAELPDLADPRVPEAAAQAHRYFAEGLPLHAADEDDSLAPRLRRVVPESGQLLDELAADHRAIDAVLATLLSILQAAADGRPVSHASLRADVTRLRALLLPHIAREEEVLFPLCAALSPSDRLEIGRELMSRRR
ncbi:MAG: hemerythrin domain-containing protein [Pseudomonadota bacterium]|nr:hemerythrin domain-containing protein [Pseudomonadota bacterium]